MVKAVVRVALEPLAVAPLLLLQKRRASSRNPAGRDELRPAHVRGGGRRVPSVPTASKARAGTFRRSAWRWSRSVSPFPSPRASTFPAADTLQTNATESDRGRFPSRVPWYFSGPGGTPQPGLGGAAVDGGLARSDGPLPVLEPVAHAPVLLPLDLDDRLEQDRLFVAERRRLGHGPVTRLVFRRSRLEDYGSSSRLLTRHRAPRLRYQDTDREVVARPSNLHLSVGKAEPQDRHVRVRLSLIDGREGLYPGSKPPSTTAHSVVSARPVARLGPGETCATSRP
jgi:hypothetical protein